MSNKCWLCGKSGYGFNRLERHHIFGGANRKKSEALGLVVLLCGDSCHRNGPKAAHKNAEAMQRLHEYGQRKAIEENGWTTEDFIRKFGKNYLQTPVSAHNTQNTKAFLQESSTLYCAN